MIRGSERAGMVRRKWLIAAGIAAAAIVLIWAARGRHPSHETGQASGPEIAVKTMTLSASSVPNEVQASGTVRPIAEARISPKIMSNVAAIYVREGDRVAAGQVLIRLESKDLQAQVAQAEAGLAATVAGSGRAHTAIDLQKAQTSTGISSAEAGLRAAREQLSLVKAGPRKQQRAQAHLAVAQAEAQLKNAEIELGRMKRLYEQDVVPKQRLDGAQTSFDVAKAQYDSAREQASLTEEGSRTQEIQTAEQQVRQAEEALRMAKAAAVQDKMSVSNAQVAASQVAQAQAALEFARTQLGYATIISPISGVVSKRMVDPGDTVSPSAAMISIQADSIYRLEVTVPESAASRVFVGRKVSVILGSDNRTGSGTISVVSPEGDPSSHKFVVKVDLPNSLNARSGEFGRISFPTSYSEGVIVPEKALHDRGGLSMVFLADKHDRARMRAVRTGRRVEGGVEVLSGLRPGDQVIVENTGALEDGAQVRIEGRL